LQSELNFAEALSRRKGSAAELNGTLIIHLSFGYKFCILRKFTVQDFISFAVENFVNNPSMSDYFRVLFFKVFTDEYGTFE
jgi:hypothetical protein